MMARIKREPEPTQPVRAILIDPAERELRMIEIVPTNANIRELIHGDLAGRTSWGTTDMWPITGSYREGGERIIASDIFQESGEAFVVSGPENPGLPECGRGLLLGFEPGGRFCDVTMSVEELHARVTFTTREGWRQEMAAKREARRA
jgi:hypothetical protein